MKYMLIKNINLLKDKLFKYFFLQIVMVFLMLFIDYVTITELENDFIAGYLGLFSIKELPIVELIFKMISVLIVAYVTLKILLNCIEYSGTYVALRIKKIKWILFNILNCGIYTILMRIIIIFIFVLAFIASGHHFEMSYLLKVIATDLLFYTSISICSILILTLAANNIVGKICAVLLLILLIAAQLINILEVAVIYLLIILLVLVIINILTFNPIKMSNAYKRG